MSDAASETAYDHIWHSRSLMTDRAGQRLRVMIVGTLNSALVEFEDGHQCVTSRFGYRRLTADRPQGKTQSAPAV